MVQFFETEEQFQEWYKKWQDSFPEFMKSEELNTPLDVEIIRIAVEKYRAELL